MKRTPASRFAFRLEYLRQGAKQRKLSGSETAKISYHALHIAMKAFIADIFCEATDAEKWEIRDAIKAARRDHEDFEVPRG